MIKFRCTECDRKIGVPDEHGGKRCKCPGCGTAQRIPQPEADPIKQSDGDGDDDWMGKLAALGDLESPSPTEDQHLQELPGEAPAMPRGAPAGRDTAEDAAHLLDQPAVKFGALGAVVVITLLALLLGNTVTAMFFVFVALAVINGYWFGASKVAAIFGGLIAAALLAAPLGQALEGVVGGVLGTSGLTNRLVSIVLIGLIIIAVVTAALQVVIKKWMEDRPDLKPLDRPIGAGLGLFEGVLLGFLVIWSLLSLEPVAATGVEASKSSPDAAPNPAAEKVVAVAESARESFIGRLADTINPMKNMRVLTLFQKVLVVLNNPMARDAFVKHEAIVGIRERPTVKKAMKMLEEDEQVMAMIQSKDGISGGDLRKILDSDVVLKIVDGTDIIAELGPMTDEIEKAIEHAYAQADQPVPQAENAQPKPGEPDFFPDAGQQPPADSNPSSDTPGD